MRSTTPFVLTASALCLVLSACSGPTIDIGGKGLISVDKVAPPGAEQLMPPSWSIGDRFVYRKGGLRSVAYRVIEAGKDSYVLEEEKTKLRMRLSKKLEEQGRYLPGREDIVRMRNSVDFVLTWPLWVGKKWGCHFMERDANGVLPVLASYYCDREEELVTAAGRFRCFRIWRTAELDVKEEWYDRVSVHWYAPKVGWFVRSLEDSQLLELEGYERQKR